MKTEGPNILLITADDMNYNTPGFMGGKVDNITPNLDQLAAEGIHFSHAHVTIAICQPSRSVLMTGRYPHRNGAEGFQEIETNVPTLQEQLHGAGYLNGIIGKENQLTPKWKFCWDTFIRTMDEEEGMGRDPKVYYNHCRTFFDKAVSEGKPFFLMANSHDPHRPFAGSEQEKTNFGFNTKVSRQYHPDEIEVPGFLPDLPDVRQEMSEYYSSVHRCDEMVGEVLRALKESGMEENTMVIYLSDNGMAIPYAKTNCYLNSTRTPWIVRWPGKIIPGSIDDRHMISGIDFMPTILQAAGLPHPQGMDGRSFLPVLQGETQDNRDHLFTVFFKTVGKKEYPMRCVQNKRFGYIYNAWSDQEKTFKNEAQSGLTFKAMKKAAETDERIAERVRFYLHRTKEELYDFENDPDALDNLAEESAYHNEMNQFRMQLLQWMESTEDKLITQFQNEIR